MILERSTKFMKPVRYSITLQLRNSVFQKDPPARATYAVAALPKGGLVEIEAVALAP
jgi:enamine deaminase RidA (YjgF/YER057c/UK114 family)